MHTLEIPADADRATVYAELLASVRALVDAEPDLVANLANVLGTSHDRVRRALRS